MGLAEVALCASLLLPQWAAALFPVNRRLRPENPSLRVMREIVLASSVQSDIF